MKRIQIEKEKTHRTLKKSVRNLPLDLQYVTLDKIVTHKNPCKTKVYDRDSRFRNKKDVVNMLATKVVNDVVRFFAKSPRLYTNILPEFVSYIQDEKKRNKFANKVNNYKIMIERDYGDKILTQTETFDLLVEILNAFTKVELCNWYTQISSRGYRLFRKNKMNELNFGIKDIFFGGISSEGYRRSRYPQHYI
jgi:hypothetical protein